MHFENATRGQVLGDRIRAADNPWTRLRGLMFHRSLERGGGLWLTPCKQVHTFWMRFPIDVLFLDREHRVLVALLHVRRGRITPLVRGAAGCLELPAGVLSATGTQEGDRILVKR